MLYCQAILPGLSTGMGNKLFPWARCKIFAKLNNGVMLTPRWSQLALGSLLRGTPRFYHNLFVTGRNELRGFQKMKASLLTRKMKEPETFQWNERDNQDVLVQFEGMSSFFERLVGWENFLLEELRHITHPQWLQIADQSHSPVIGMHIRLGDFQKIQSQEDLHAKGGVRTPLSWFANSLSLARELLGYEAPATIFSDGSATELSDLLNMKKVSIQDSGSPIGDLLILSRSSILLASGGSTFSAWASFFGRMPTFSVPGQSLSWYKLNSPEQPYQGILDPSAPSPECVDSIKSAFP